MHDEVICALQLIDILSLLVFEDDHNNDDNYISSFFSSLPSTSASYLVYAR